MQLEESLGANHQVQLHRCRGLTEEREDCDEECKSPALKRSKKTVQDFNDFIGLAQADSADVSSIDFFAGIQPAKVKCLKSASRDKHSPHNDAFFYFFLRHLDELLSSWPTLARL